MSKFAYPKISDGRDQLLQIRSFLYQLVDQLNFAQREIDTQFITMDVPTGSSAAQSPEKEAQTTFNSIKALIIKSADIVNAYYDEINYRLEGVYVAQSEFGSYAQQTLLDIQANAEGIKQLYENLQAIVTDIDSLEHSVVETNAYINSGLLYYDDKGAPVYGLEIGQRSEIDGVEVFNKFSRFTSDRLSFYDQNDNEVAFISDRKLCITYVEITGGLLMGGFQDDVLADGSIVTKWMR